MKAQSLKIELLEWLNSIEDIRVLSTLMQFKKAATVEDWAEKLTDDQLESLKRGISQLNNIFLFPINSIEGNIYATGNVVLKNNPIVSPNVIQHFTGRLILD